MLEKVGHRITVAGNGQEALELFDRERFDLILMDVMPVMGGLRGPRRSGAAKPGAAGRRAGSGTSIPIVAMTAHAMEGDRTDARGGMDDYIADQAGCCTAVIDRAMGEAGDRRRRYGVADRMPGRGRRRRDRRSRGDPRLA